MPRLVGWQLIFRTLSSGQAFRSKPPSPRAPLLQRHYPPSLLLRAHAQIPVPLIFISCPHLEKTSLPLAPSTAGHRDRPALVCLSFLECLYTGGSTSAPNQFFPVDIGLRLTTLARLFRKSSHKTASRGLSFSIRRAFLYVAALQFACPPDRSAPWRLRTSYIRACCRFVASATVGCATRPTGQLPGLDFHQQERQPLSAAP